MAILTITRGDNEKLKALITPSSAVASGVFFMAKKALSDLDSAAIINKSLGAGITVVVPGSDSPSVPAQLQIAIDSADTKVLPNRTTTLQYELEDGAGHTFEGGTGKLIIKPEVRLA